MSEVRAARVFALLNMALHDAAVGCWETKYFYFNPRPSHMDPDLKSIIGLPNFPSYTSGHSTFSGAASEVLSYLFPGAAAEFERLKEEASISRVYGGIHYRTDLEMGKAHGRRIGGYTVSCARTDVPTDAEPTVNPPASSNVMKFIGLSREGLDVLTQTIVGPCRATKTAGSGLHGMRDASGRAQGVVLHPSGPDGDETQGRRASRALLIAPPPKG
jgi:PAP2 superfamily